MAQPIRLGLTLEGEDARELEKQMQNPNVTEEQVEFFREAIKTYKDVQMRQSVFVAEINEKIDNLNKYLATGDSKNREYVEGMLAGYRYALAFYRESL